jgi:hypothetical protein
MNSSYRDELKNKIRELERKIVTDENEKINLMIELNRLRVADFEEAIKEDQEAKLLKG